MSIQPVSFQATNGAGYLNQLLTCEKNRWKKASGSVITTHAQTCLNQIKRNDSNLWWSEWKKFFSVHGTYYGCLTTPLVVSGVGVYASYNHWDAVKGPLGQIGEGLNDYAVKPAVDLIKNAFKKNTEVSYATAGLGGGATGILLLQDLFSHKSVLKGLVKGLAAATVYSYFQFAAKQRDMVEKWFVEWEKDYRKDKQVAHDGIFRHMKTQFAAAAQELLVKSQIEDPAELFNFQKDIVQLNKNLSTIIRDLKKLKLTEAEISEILLPLTENVKLIQNQKFSLKVGTNISDYGYNARLIAGLPLSKNTCLPAISLENVDIAKANELGIGHPIKKIGASLVGGLASITAITALALAAASQYSSSEFDAVKSVLLQGNAAAPLETNVKAAVGAVAGVALVTGAGITKVVANRWTKEAKENQAFVNERYDAARKEINDLYSGIATYFYLENEKPGNKAQTKALATLMNDKLPGIVRMIDMSKIKGLTGLDATQPLRDILTIIMNGNVA